MSDVEKSTSKQQTNEEKEDLACDDAIFFAHDGIETFAELKERLKIKAKPAAGTDGR